MIHEERIRKLNQNPVLPGDYVLYWMQQSQRATGNHALELTIRRANELGVPPVVLFVVTDRFPEANLRHYRFMLEGVRDTAARMAERGIPFFIYYGDILAVISKAADRASLLVTDRGYLRVQRQWRSDIARRVPCLCVQVESDVVVPVETAYPKEAYSAGILRPKIHAQLDLYLLPLKESDPLPEGRKTLPKNLSALSEGGLGNLGDLGDIVNLGDPREPGWIEMVEGKMDLDRSVGPVEWIRGGTSAALEQLEIFVEEKLPRFDTLRNDPSEDYLSNLSPYLHFGQISPLDIALRIGEPVSPAAASFLEELIVRRELAMNFAFYNPDYDRYECLHPWARESLEIHEVDPRDYLYTLEDFEAASTHDPYWNAAQRELSTRGKMHGYMRMYWGKKILEWSPTPGEAFRTALYLNNRYSLDGRDPNGFAGVAWCFGKHDRAWSERQVFGKVRYMNANGLRRKFDIEGYVSRVMNF